MGYRNTIKPLYQQRTLYEIAYDYYWLLCGKMTKVAFVPFAVVQGVWKYVGDKVGNRPITAIGG